MTRKPLVRRMSAIVLGPFLSFVACTDAAPPPPEPSAASVATAVPDVEGGWTRLDAAGSGSFGGLADHIPKALLTPQGEATVKQAVTEAAGRPGPGRGFDYDENRPHEAGEAYIVTNGGCGLPGGIEPNSAAFHIVQSADEILMVRENPGLHRNVYMDGRPHPALGRWTPTATGHSVGRYENAALVVDTIGLTAGTVPAGGYRTPETRLTERYRVSDDGKHLTVTYTWEDPKIYQKPHAYDIEYERLPPGAYAFEWWCDSSDPRQRESIVPPEQRP